MFNVRQRTLAILTLLTAGAICVPSHATHTIYSDEATYLADLATPGYIASDGFEDDNFWGLLETDVAPDVTSQGVTWTGLGGGVTLNRLVERSGDWGLESSPPGSPFDGFLATSSEPLYGFGGWVKSGNAGSGGQNDVSVFLNGSATSIDGFGAPTSNYVFWGIIDPAGINSIQFETEPVDPPEPGSGDPIDPSKTILFDDFTFGFATPPSLREPGTAWTNAASDTYTTGGNWNGGAAPATTDNALFHLGSAAPYTVHFSQNETASQAVIANDKVAFDLGGFQYNLTEPNITRESLIVGERPGDVGELTLTNGTLSGANVVVAHSTTSTGHLTVDTGAAVNLTGTMRVGSGGNGTLDINAGSVVTSSGTGVTYGGIVGQLNGTGTVNVTGAGAQWNVTSFKTLAVGLGGTGTLNVSDGAAVSTWFLLAGAEAGNRLDGEPTGMGTIIVSGAGTTLGGGGINIGQHGPASMTVTDGAQVTGRGGSIALGADADVLLDGAGSSWTMNIGGSARGTLNIGVGDQIGSFASTPPPPMFTGTLTIQNGASVVAEETFIGKTRKGRGILTVTGLGSSWSSGSQFLGNTFIGHEGDGELNVLEGATIQTGQTMIGRHGLRDRLRGVANISGIGSAWNTPSTIWVGFNNDPQFYFGAGIFVAEGVLNVTDGGAVNAGQLSLAGRNISIGVVNVSGSGSTISTNSVAFGKTTTTTFTFGSNAEMTIADNGLLDVTNDIDIHHGILTLDDGTINATNLRLHGELLIDPATNQFEPGDTRVTLAGNGQINANVINEGGFVAPGLSAGTLDVLGNYSQSTEGTLAIELGGTNNADSLNIEFDQLLINGTATVGGTLEVSLIDTGNGLFTPSTGNTFDILTATGGVSGTFATTSLPALTGGLSWDVVYDANSVMLDVVGIFGDVNLDGTLDANDIDALAVAASAGSTDLLFDLDGDGAVSFSVSGSGVSSDSDTLIRTLLGTEYGDANLDGQVDILDLDLLGQGFGSAGSGWLFGDFDGSGLVDIIDLDLLGQTYGFSASPQVSLAVPEPTACSLACFAAALLMVGRGRTNHFRYWHFLQGRLPASRWVRLGIVGVTLGLAIAQPSQADLVFNDPQGLASVTVSTVPSTATGYLTHTFSVTPLQLSTEVTSMDASFSATEVRQVNPSGASTVFTDFNGFFGDEGEDPSGDSQFLFASTGVLVGSQSESAMSLAAAFTGFLPIQSSSPFAQLVLPTALSGTANLTFVLRDIGSLGVGQTASFSGLTFGATAIPEPSAFLFGSLICGAVSLGMRRRQRSMRLTRETTA